MPWADWQALRCTDTHSPWHGTAGVSGRVAVNGVAVTGAAMGRFAGYVLQDDVLPGSSTVQEYLRWVRCSVTECCSQL